MSGSDSSLDNLFNLFKFKPHIYDISSFKLDHYKIQKEKDTMNMGTVSKQPFLITPIATGALGHFLVVMMTTRGL